MKNLYKIDHYYNDTHDGVFIESDMNLKKISDIIIGLQFYIEDSTKYGENTCITEEMAAYLLCKYFNCENYDYNDKNKRRYYDIDLYTERECRCGENYKKYIEEIKPYIDTEYLKKLSLYFNDDNIFSKEHWEMLSIEEILEKY